jgi:hypothetical protein
VLFWSFNVLAQQDGSNTSGEMYSGEKYVSNTGQATVSVPIYAFNSGKIHHQVGLNYDASGILVRELAGWNGLKWNLQASGAIVRQQHGSFHDDKDNFGAPGSGFGFRYSDVDANFNDYITKIATGLKDGEPDCFVINAPGLSGQFYISRTGSIKVASNDNLDVQANYDVVGQLNSFTVINGLGIKYVFDVIESVNQINYNYSTTYDSYNSNYPNNRVDISGSNYTAEWMNTAWWLSSIEDANGQNAITFTYTNEEISEIIPAKATYAMYTTTPPNPVTTGVAVDYIVGQNITQSKKISVIEWAGNRIEFVSSAQGRDDYNLGNQNTFLKYVDVYNNQNELVEKYQFNYSYYNDPSCISGYSNFCKRLKLDNIQRYKQGDPNLASNYSDYYVFTYNSNTLPSRYSNKMDYWGYYKDYGSLADNNSLPRLKLSYISNTENRAQQLRIQPFQLSAGICSQDIKFYSCTGSCNTPQYLDGVDRSSNLNDLAQGTIQSVKSIKSGITTYDYELHSFSNFNIQATQGAGLRVKSVKLSDFDNNLKGQIKVEYGAGSLISIPQFGFSYNDVSSCPTGVSQISKIYSDAKGLEKIGGSYVIYDEITTSQIDINNPSNIYPNGKVITEYYNPVLNKNYTPGTFGGSDIVCFENGVSPSEIFSVPQTIRTGYSMLPSVVNQPFPNMLGINGLVKSKKLYNSDNLLLSETSYFYELKDYEQIQTTSAIGTNTTPAYSQSYFNIGWVVPRKEQTNSIGTKPYTGSFAAATKQNSEVELSFNSQYHKELTSEKTTNSEGEVVEKRYKYSSDYFALITSPSGLDQMTDALYKMNTKHMTSIPIEETSLVTKSGSNYILSSTITNFADFGTTTPQVYPKSTYVLKENALLIESNFTFADIVQNLGNSQFIQDSRYELLMKNNIFAANGSVIEFEDRTGAGNTNIYEGTNPILVASFSNSRKSDCAYTSFENGTNNNGWFSGPSPTQNSTYSALGSKCGQVEPNNLINYVVYVLEPNEQKRDMVFSFKSKTPAGYQGNLKAIVEIYEKGNPSNLITTVDQIIPNSSQFEEQRIIVNVENVRSSNNLATTFEFGYRLKLSRVNMLYSGSIYLDDFAIYPKGSVGNYLATKPLVGAIANGNSTGDFAEIEYDHWNRPILYRDLEGNITKKIEYNTK